MSEIPNSPLIVRRASGCLFGVACGDALGAPVERLSRLAMMGKFPNGPQEFQGEVVRVTDDTQLTLAVGEALVAARRPFTPAGLEQSLTAAFIAWLRSPDNDREPGVTTTESCKRLEAGIPWYQATGDSQRGRSVGCGATMRVAPVGLLRLHQDLATPSMRAAIAQFQSALTHIHPTALTASDLTAAAIADLIAGGDPLGLPARLRSYAESQRLVYHYEWLGLLWKHKDLQGGYETGENYISQGWDDCLKALDNLEAVLAKPDDGSDVSTKQTGSGHRADTAFATGLLCFLLYPKEPLSAIRRAAFTDGDSDTLAGLAGAFAGAHLGITAWPSSWLDRIEYRERLSVLGSFWD